MSDMIRIVLAWAEQAELEVAHLRVELATESKAAERLRNLTRALSSLLARCHEAVLYCVGNDPDEGRWHQLLADLDAALPKEND